MTPSRVAMTAVLRAPEPRPIPLRVFESLPGTYPGTYKRNVIVWLVYLLVALVAAGFFVDLL